MNRRKSVLASVLLLAASLYFAAVARAENIKIAYPSASVEFTPLFAAKDEGLFDKYDLHVQLILMQGGSQVVQALLGGSVDFVVMGGAFLTAAIRGADLVMIATHMNRFPYSVVVKPGIESPQQLKGKKLGVSSFGSTSEAALRLSLERFGLNPNTDVTILQVGGQSSRFAALKAGSIDGTVVIAPFTGAAKRLGYNVLFNMAKLGIPYPQEGVVVSRAYASKHRPTIVNFLKPFVEGIRDIKQNKEFAIGVMARHFHLDPVKDQDALENAYQEVVLDQIVKDPKPDIAAVKAALEIINQGKQGNASTNAQNFVDTTFMNELEKSGFIDSLYK